MHDIAYPLCREKYRNADGIHHEVEGLTLVVDFQKDSDMCDAQDNV